MNSQNFFLIKNTNLFSVGSYLFLVIECLLFFFCIRNVYWFVFQNYRSHDKSCYIISAEITLKGWNSDINVAYICFTKYIVFPCHLWHKPVDSIN